MSRMYKPPHPGEVLRDGVVDAGVSVTEFAARLGVNRVTLSRLLHGQAGVSAEMAMRLAKALGGSAQSWLHMQANYDLWQAERSTKLKKQIAQIAPLARKVA
jgi:addiction module HigA family antidote